MTDVTKLKHFRWMPGMLMTSGYRVGQVTVGDLSHIRRPLPPSYNPPQLLSAYNPHIGATSHMWLDIVTEQPDLTDPATLGCMLALVREAWAPNIVVFGGWRAVHIYAPNAGRQWVEGDLAPYVWESDEMGEAEALVAALEAAP